MPAKPVVQSQWINGLNAVMGQLSQQKGTFPQSSNMLLTKRGSLQTCDGTDLFVSPAGSDTSVPGAVLDLIMIPPQLSPVSPGGPSLAWIQECGGSHLGAPSSLVVTETTGTWANGTYTFEITGLDGVGGETTPCTPVAHTVSAGPVGLILTWNGSFNGSAAALSYNVYQLSGGIYKLIANVAAVAGTSQTVTFANPQSIGTQVSPAVNTTSLAVYRWLPSATAGQVYDNTGASGPATQVFSPLDPSPVLPAGVLTSNMLTANGGVSGLLSALPQIIAFGGTSNQENLYLILGNGIPPMTAAGGGTPAALANNFTVWFPARAASTVYNNGSVVVPATPNGHFYKAVQAGSGTSGSGSVSFRTDGGSVADGTVVWQDQGSDAIPAPRGAAHGINHLASLWVFNTSPTNSADGLDGPAMLAQSDVNNAQSWPPQYRVKIGSDDGQEGMGLANFTVAEAGIAPSPFMVAFKNYSTYLINGNFTPSSGPAIVQLQTDLGCIAPRSIQFLSPLGGVIRLTHKGFAITNGINDDPSIGESIRNWIFGGNSATGNVTPVDPNLIYFSHSSQTATDPPMYVCACPLAGGNGKATRLFCLDLILKSWTVVDLPFPVYAISLQALGTYPPVPKLILTGYADGIFRLAQNSDDAWDTGPAITWSVLLPNVFKDGGCSASYFRDVLIRGTALSASVSITVQLFAQGVGQSAITTQRFNFTNGQFEARMFPNQRQLNMWAIISGTGRAIIDSLVWTVRAGRESVPISLMRSA